MALPSITLTREDELRLAAVAESVVKNAVEEYNEHLTVHNGVVDERRWKKIKQRDDMRVYRERSTSHDGVTTGASRGDAHVTHSTHSNSYSSSETDGETSDDVKTVAPMLAFGSIEVSLDDAMYGAISPSIDDMLLKSAYTEDGFVDWTLVAPIIAPTERDPFRELSMKYTVKGHSLLVGAVHRQRSALYIESAGIAQTPNGERIGYHVYHSVDVPEICEQPGASVVRAKLSFCYLFRQRRANCIEVYIRGVFCPMGEASASITAFTTADIVLSVSRNTHCAEMKKLTRVLSSQPAAVRALVSSSSSTSGSSRSSGRVGDDDEASTNAKSSGRKASCAQCNKSISSKLTLLRSSSKGKSCAMCGSRLCSSCRVYKTLFTPSAKKEKELTQSSRAFCTSCLACVMGAWSAKFAALDVRAAQGEHVDYAAVLSQSA
jgi:hypothetical protein